MTRKKQTVTRTVQRRAVEPEIETVVTTEIDGENADRLAAIAAALSDNPLDDNWSADVYAIEKGQPAEFLYKVPVSEVLDLSIRDRLRDEVGSGVYRVIVREGTIIRQCGNFRVRRLGPPIGQPVAQQPAASSELTMILAALKQQHDAMMAVMARVTAPAISQGDDVDRLTKLATLLATMQGLTGTKAAESSTDILLKGIELGKSVMGEGRESGMIDILKSTIESGVLTKMMDAGAARAAQPRPDVVPVALPKPITPGPRALRSGASSEVTRVDSAPPDMNALAGQLEFLCGRAAVDSDPALYADVLADLLPEAMLKSLVEAPEITLEQFAQLVPAVREHGEWFLDLLDNVADIVAGGGSLSGSEGRNEPLDAPEPASAAPATSRPDPGRPGRNSRNPKGDAAPDTGGN